MWPGRSCSPSPSRPTWTSTRSWSGRRRRIREAEETTQLGQYQVSVVYELLFGIPHHGESGRSELQLLATVPIDLSGRAMVAPAIELDHQSLRAPERIDLPACYPDVELG